MNATREKFNLTLKRWNLLQAGENVLVAVSGGLDSVVLLHLLLHLPPKTRPKIHAVHFNHRLRGHESREDMRFVKKLCSRWGVPFYSGQAPVWRKKNNLEAKARELRYAFFQKIGKKLGIDKLATAHQADDQAETFLIRWLQGAGLRGLAGIPLIRCEGDLKLIRPLLFTSRLAIFQYARSFKLPYRTDSSNAQVLFLRNRVRRILKFAQRENPRIEERSALNAIFLRADQEFLEAQVEKIFRRGADIQAGHVYFGLGGYQHLAEGVRYRLLQKMVAELTDGGTLPADAVLKVDELLLEKEGGRHYDLPHQVGLSRRKKRFCFYRKDH